MSVTLFELRNIRLWVLSRHIMLIFVQDWEEKAPCGSYLIVLASMHLCILSL